MRGLHMRKVVPSPLVSRWLAFRCPFLPPCQHNSCPVCVYVLQCMRECDHRPRMSKACGLRTKTQAAQTHTHTTEMCCARINVCACVRAHARVSACTYTHLSCVPTFPNNSPGAERRLDVWEETCV